MDKKYTREELESIKAEDLKKIVADMKLEVTGKKEKLICAILGEEYVEPVTKEPEPVRTDGKVAVKKDGVTRRIRPDQLSEWQSQGWQ